MEKVINNIPAFFKNFTEKWKPLKVVLPGEGLIISYCALSSTPYRPARRFGVLDFKMKSEVTALL